MRAYGKCQIETAKGTVCAVDPTMRDDAYFVWMGSPASIEQTGCCEEMLSWLEER